MRSLATETIRNLSWFLLLISALTPQISFRKLLISSVTARYIALILITISALELFYIWVPGLTYHHIITLHLAQSVIGLWLIEQLFRRTNKNARWEIKPLCLGLGMTFAYDFALYANGLLTSIIDSNFLYARGWVTLLTVPLILLTSRRIKNWSARVYVSRDVVYHSTLLIAAGGYLLVMAISGYYIRYAGGNWGSMAQNIFFALSGLMLVSLFLSETLRRNLKVLITKHFYANKYEYRQEWMKFASILEENMASPYQVALNAMLKPFQCEYGTLATLEGNRLKRQFHYNHTIEEFTSENGLEALAISAIQHRWIVDIDELKKGKAKAPFAYDSQAVSKINTFSYIVPIISSGGINSVVLLSTPKSTHQLNWEDRDLMWAISTQLAFYLNLNHTNQTIAENQQFDTFNRMSAYLTHDLKNILAQLQLLSKNAARHKDNPEFIDDAFETIDSAANRLNKVVTHLRKKNTEIQQDETFRPDNIISQVCKDRAINSPQPTYRNLCSKEVFLKADKERFSNVIAHLIQNAQDATAADGTISVALSESNNTMIIDIKDTGVGMSEDFIKNRLFKPFDTTKGNSGMGIGAYDAKKLVEKLGGYIEVTSKQNEGTCLSLNILVDPSIKN